MRRRFLFMVSVAALAGCQAGPDWQSRMAAYIGADSQTLVQDLGVPDKQIAVNGVEYFAYDRHHVDVIPGSYFGGWGPFGGPGFYDPPQVMEYSCETTFRLKGNKVSDFMLRGNDCG
jgi:hypothetical protein